MKKRKVVFLAVLTMLVAMMLGMTSMAATTKVVITKSDTYYKKGDANNNDVTYYKISVKQTGYLNVFGFRKSSVKYDDSRYGLAIQLCNSRKQPLEDEYNSYLSKSDSWREYYGVKKGIYYIKVKGGNHTLKYSFKPVKEVCGSTKAKASSLTRNKTRVGLLIAGEKGNKEEWYKVRLPKAQKLKFTIDGRSNGYVAFEVIPASKRVILTGSYQSCWNKAKKIETTGALPAGTYYIKVYRSNGKSSNSGWYSIKWR